MRKLFAIFCAIQSCMALTLTPHDAVFQQEGCEEDLEVSVDVNSAGDAILAIGEEGQVKVAIKNGNEWSELVPIAYEWGVESLQAKIDDEGNVATFWERGGLWGTKKEKGSWLPPQYIFPAGLSPYEVNSNGEVLFFAKFHIDPSMVYLVKTNLQGDMSKQFLGPINDWSDQIEGVIAKSWFGNRLFLWKNQESCGHLNYCFVYEKQGMLDPYQSFENLFLDFFRVWDIKAALSSHKTFALVGTGYAEWTDYDDWICGTLVEDPHNFPSRSFAPEEEIDDIAVAVDPHDQFLVVWEGKDGISATSLHFDGEEDPKVPAPSLFLEKVSIKNGNFYFQPDPEGGFTLVWQQDIFDRENRKLEHALYACRYDPSSRQWTEAERLSPKETDAFLKGFATGPKGDRIVVWTEWVDGGVQLRVGSLN